MHRHHIDVIHNAPRGEPLDEGGIDGRHAAEHPWKGWILGCDGLARQARHTGEDLPVRIQVGIPVRLVVGLVPDLDRFDHAKPPPLILPVPFVDGGRDG